MTDLSDYREVHAQESLACDLIDALIDLHAEHSTSLQEAAALLKEHSRSQPAFARRVVLLGIGYVPSNPQGWVRLHRDRFRFDGGPAWPGFDAA